MSYSGNPSVSSDVKQRILTTFDQTLELAREGSRQEALLGCDFVLRMDPQFQPAQVLQERLRASDGPVRLDDLKKGPATAVDAADDPFADLDGLSLDDLPDLLPDDGGSAAGSLRDELQSLLDQRRFQELMATAQREAGAVTADPDLQRIVGSAQELMEAEPYVLKFLNSAQQALQAGQSDEAGRLLDKARSLDASHPGIAELEAARSAAAPSSFKIPSPLQTGAMPASLAFGGGDSESDRRIRELLTEGQTAFDAGDPQGAIDAWSRIFLIDIDHQEASRRIEAARKLKAESERQVEEIFHDGLGRLEAGDVDGARQAFQRVLEIQPGYFAAREYLQQLDAGVVPTPRPAGLRDMTAAEPVLSLPSDLEVAGGPDLKEEILVPPEPGETAAPAAERRPARRTVAVRDGSRARRQFMMVGGAVLLIALVGGWFAWQNWDRLFPNSEEEAALPSNLSQDPIGRAERLHKAGKTPIALNQLRRVPPTDPQYAKAQKLIAEWGGAAPAPGAPTAGTAAGPKPAATPVLDRRQLLLIAARQAYAERRYLRAVHRLEQAAATGKLEAADAQMLTEAKKILEPMTKQITAFRDHEWEYVLPDLWRMRNEDPENPDVKQMIVDSYYNLAVRDLQRADAKKAVENFQEALALEGNDESAQRHLAFAQTYQERPKDLLYKIYVKYLQYR